MSRSKLGLGSLSSLVLAGTVGVAVFTPCSAAVWMASICIILSQSGQWAGVFHAHPVFRQSTGSGFGMVKADGVGCLAHLNLENINKSWTSVDVCKVRRDIG